MSDVELRKAMNALLEQTADLWLRIYELQGVTGRLGSLDRQHRTEDTRRMVEAGQSLLAVATQSSGV